MKPTTAPPTLAVDCRSLTKHYGTGNALVWALRGVNLQVHTGQLLMLVGPSGCGKTTLLSVIAGILERDQGECQVLGQDMSKLNPVARTAYRGRNIGFVFQSYNLLPSLTAAQNVAVPLMINGVSLKKATVKAVEILRQVGLDDRMIHSAPSELSGGQQQRVAISRALIHQPRLIVCDEPTAALDQQTGLKVMQVLKEVAVCPDRAVIVVTHDSRIFHLADRIAWMNDGQIQRIDDPSTSSDLPLNSSGKLHPTAPTASHP